MSFEPIRYGIVALGRAGWGIHIKDLRPRQDARIVAVADPQPERRKEAVDEFGCKAYERIDDMLNQDDVEVAVIATPSISHGPDAIASLRAGKHVIVEKPMAMNVAEADCMIAAAGETGRKLMVHQNYRFRREFTHLTEIVDSGLLGRLYHIRNYLTGFNPRYDWQTLAKNGGGLLNNTCPHFIDMILQLLGAPVTEVMGDLRQIASAGDVEDHVKAMLRAANGCTADMEITTAQNVAASMPKWILCGTHGTLTCDGTESVIRWFDPDQVAPIEAIDAAVPDRAYHSADLPWQEKTVEAQGPDIGGFYDNVTAVLRRGEPMYVTPESVRQVIDAIARIRKGTAFEGN